MIQDFLTQTITTTTIAAVGYFTLLFITGLMSRYRRICPGQLEIDFAAIDEAIELANLQPFSAFIEPEPQPEVKPAAVELAEPEQAIEPAAPAGDELENMTIRQLKKLASELKVKRYCNMRLDELRQAIRQARPVTA